MLDTTFLSTYNHSFLTTISSTSSKRAYEFLKLYATTPEDWLLCKKDMHLYACKLNGQTLEHYRLTDLFCKTLSEEQRYSEICKIFHQFKAGNYLTSTHGAKPFPLIDEYICLYTNQPKKVFREAAEAAMRAQAKNCWMIRYDQFDEPYFCTLLKKEDGRFYYSEKPFHFSNSNETHFYQYFYQSDIVPLFNYVRPEEISLYAAVQTIKSLAETISPEEAFQKLSLAKENDWILLKNSDDTYTTLAKAASPFFLIEYFKSLDISNIANFCKKYRISNRVIIYPLQLSAFNENVYPNILDSDVERLFENKRPNTWLIRKGKEKGNYSLIIKTAEDHERPFICKEYLNYSLEALMIDVCSRCGWHLRLKSPHSKTI